MCLGATNASIDSVRALGTTLIFVLKTTRSFDGENSLLGRFPPQYVLNRIVGGRDAARFAALLGVDQVIKTREFSAPETQAESR